MRRISQEMIALIFGAGHMVSPSPLSYSNRSPLGRRVKPHPHPGRNLPDADPSFPAKFYDTYAKKQRDKKNARKKVGYKRGVIYCNRMKAA